MGRKLKVEEDYYKLFESTGYIWVGGILPNKVMDKTWWKCREGHLWQTSYSAINRGYNCRKCMNKVGKSGIDYYNVGKSRGIKWGGVVLPRTTKTETWWECKEGHRWKTTYNVIQKGSGCPVCYINANMKTKTDYYNVAKDRAIRWVGGNLPKNVHTNTWWECKEGHRWNAPYSNIKQGTGCFICYVEAQKNTEQDYYNLAKNRGFKWISCKLPENTRMNTRWECKKGHKWKATYGDIRSGNGCPHCRDMVNGQPVSKPQRKLNNLLCGSLNYPEGRYRIDVAIMRKSQKIAVEYDAQYWHQGNEEHDAKRDNYLINKGWKVLHIKSGNLLPFRKQIRKAINQLLNNKKIVNIFLEDWKD